MTTEVNETADTQPAPAPKKPRQLTQGELMTRFSLDWTVEPVRRVVVPVDWQRRNLVPYAPGLYGHATHFMIHKDAVQAFEKFFHLVHDAKLDDRILTFDGSFVPRFKRGVTGTSASDLSRHSRGIALDINARWNPMGAPGAKLGEKGSVVELIPLMHEAGLVSGADWKGTSHDPQHMEVGVIA